MTDAELTAIAERRADGLLNDGRIALKVAERDALVALARQARTEREQIASYVKSCREDDTDRPCVQVFDVLAKHIREGKHVPAPPTPEAP